LNSFYEKAAGTPTGQKVVNFYTQTSRQVQDIHTEARRLADIKKQEAAARKAPHTTHEIAVEDTNIVDSAKVAPLEPTKGT
jgi:hypothetical protein